MTRQAVKNNIPMRRCIGCMNSFPKNELIRVIRTPDGNVELDLTGRKNGRGAYLCKNIACLEKAMKNRGIERSFGMKVDPLVFESLKEELINDK